MWSIPFIGEKGNGGVYSYPSVSEIIATILCPEGESDLDLDSDLPPEFQPLVESGSLPESFEAHTKPSLFTTYSEPREK